MAKVAGTTRRVARADDEGTKVGARRSPDRVAESPSPSPMGRVTELLSAYKDVILYLVFGVLTTIVNIVTYWVCAHPLGLGTLASSVIGWFASVSFAFLTNRTWVFHSDVTGAAGIAREAVAFFGGRLATGFVDWAGMWLLVDVLSLPDLWTKAGLNVIVVVLNYVISKLVVFRKPLSGISGDA